MNLSLLKDPFAQSELEWRIQTSGIKKEKPWAMVLTYIDSRAVMRRLDEVVGPENWHDEYQHKDDGVMCGISIRSNNGWVTKWDGAPETSVEAFKGGISKAFVRCAVKWGIGRYLYQLPAKFADTSLVPQKGWNRGYMKESKSTFYWKEPVLAPQWYKKEKKQ